MIDHCSISVNDYEKSQEFYDQTLLILGYQRLITIDRHETHCSGYGIAPKPSFWLSPLGRTDEEIGRAKGVHIAFKAPSIEAIDKWYEKCLELGGIDNGPPGPRPRYHPGYYGAFIIDPNGWRIEAAFHDYRVVEGTEWSEVEVNFEQYQPEEGDKI